jgi:WW domain
VNHDTQTTQWEKPVVVSIPQIHDALSDLPAGWEVSIHHTQLYCVHSSTELYTIVWGSTCQHLCAKVYLGAVVHAILYLLSLPHSGDAVCKRCSNTTTAQALCSNYYVHTCCAYTQTLRSQAKLTQDGRTYYVDHNTKQTHWHHPRGLVKAAAKVRRASTKQLMIDEKIPKRDMPALIELSSSDSDSDRESDTPLPNGWDQMQTAAGRTYYVRTHTHMPDST